MVDFNYEGNFDSIVYGRLVSNWIPIEEAKKELIKLSQLPDIKMNCWDDEGIAFLHYSDNDGIEEIQL